MYVKYSIEAAERHAEYQDQVWREAGEIPSADQLQRLAKKKSSIANRLRESTCARLVKLVYTADSKSAPS